MKLTEENITGNILKHMIHSEDLILLGEKGCNLMINTLYDVFNALKGNTSNSKITQKIDGAPAVVSATDFYGKKFVALKHSWDKGKIYTSVKEIESEYSDRPELANKLTSLFNNLDFINIPKNEIWMGDYLFSKEDIKTQTIDGEEYITFHPNTIIYAVPVKDAIARIIQKADIGIAWHTKYTGTSFEDLHINFDVSVENVNSVPTVYQMDANLPNIAGKVTMTSSETEIMEANLSSLKSDLDNIRSNSNYSLFVSNEKLIELLNTYRNYIIKSNNNQFSQLDGFTEWVTARFNKEKDTKKTDKGKAGVDAKLQELLNNLNENQNLITSILKAQNKAATLKEFFVKKLDNVSSLKSFVNHINNGYIPTSGEGYAISDIDGNVQKLVNRLEFSRNNFSQEIVKGWMSNKREKQGLVESQIKKFREDNENKGVKDFIPKENLNDYQKEALSIIDKAKEEEIEKNSNCGLQYIDTSGHMVYSSDKKTTLNLKYTAGGIGRIERAQAYGEIANYIIELGKKQKEDDSIPFYYSVKNYEVASDLNAGGSEGTPIIIYKDDKSTGKHVEIGTIRLRNLRKTNGSAERKIDPSDFIKTPEMERLKDSNGDYRVSINEVSTYINSVISKTKQYYGEDSPELNILLYFFDESKNNINTSDSYLIELSKKAPAFIVQLCELVVPYFILTKKTINNDNLLPKDITIGDNAYPVSFTLPTSAVQKYIDCYVTFNGEKGTWDLNISCKAGSGTNVGETSIISIFKDGLYTIPTDINKQNTETYFLSQSFEELKRTNGPKHYHMGSIWLEGLRLIKEFYNFEIPSDTTKYDIWKNMRALYDKSLKNDSKAYPKPSDPNILKQFLKNGKIYEGIKNSLNKAIQAEFKKDYISSTKSQYQNIDSKLFNDTYPYSITSAFGIMIANRIRNEKESLCEIEEAMSQIDYYQYKMDSSYKIHISPIGNPNPNKEKIVITDPKIDFEYKWVRYTPDGFHTNSVDFGVIIK